DDGGKVLRRHIRGADDQPASNPVQLNERQRRDKLVPGGDKNGASGELWRSAAETRAIGKAVDTNAGRAAVQEALWTLRRVTQPVSNRRHGVQRRVHKI